MNVTEHNHYEGDILTFEEQITGVGGNTTKVEVFDGENWSDNIIPDVPSHFGLTALTVVDVLYIFCEKMC